MLTLSLTRSRDELPQGSLLGRTTGIGKGLARELLGLSGALLPETNGREFLVDLCRLWCQALCALEIDGGEFHLAARQCAVSRRHQPPDSRHLRTIGQLPRRLRAASLRNHLDGRPRGSGLRRAG